MTRGFNSSTNIIVMRKVSRLKHVHTNVALFVLYQKETLHF